MSTIQLVCSETTPTVEHKLHGALFKIPGGASIARTRSSTKTKPAEPVAIENDKSQTGRAPEVRRFATEAARLCATTRCHSVVVLDVTGLSPVCDFFVLATGTSSRQMRSVAEDIGELGKTQNFAPISESGEEAGTWILVDCVDVIVHIFNDESRQYYDLDNLWGDAKRVAWEKELTK